jgi:hypothetical protein
MFLSAKSFLILSVDLFSISQKFQIDVLLEFHPNHESGRTTQHGHTQANLRDEPAVIEKRVQSFSIRDASRPITFHSLPIPTNFLCRVGTVPLYNSHTSYTNLKSGK